MAAQTKRSSLLKKGQLWFGALLVLLIQLAFIFWLGDRQPVRPRSPDPAPQLQIVGRGYAAMLRIVDPTLFALPHEEGFSGPGWLIPRVQEIQPFAWSDEPERWLDLAVGQLGVALRESVGTNGFELLPTPATLEPELLIPALTGPSPFAQQSALRLEGDLARRRLLTPPGLRSWPFAELVSNTVVQVTVDAEGMPFSVALLERSGDAEADQFALQQARKARFEPLPPADASPAMNLTWGTLIFEWHTVPVPTGTVPPDRAP